MARNRMIRPEFWEDTKVSSLSPYARLFFIALWNFSDDEGYARYDAPWLRAKVFPYEPEVDIQKLIAELLRAERIEIENEIIHVKNFLKYQTISHPTPSPLRKQFHESSGALHESSGAFTEPSLRTPSQEKLREVKRRENDVDFKTYSQVGSKEIQSPTTHARTETSTEIQRRLTAFNYQNHVEKLDFIGHEHENKLKIEGLIAQTLTNKIIKTREN